MTGQDRRKDDVGHYFEQGALDPLALYERSRALIEEMNRTLEEMGVVVDQRTGEVTLRRAAPAKP